MHIAELTKEGFLRKIEEVIGQIHDERREAAENGGELKKQLNLYPKEDVFERVSEVYEEVL